MFKFSQYFLIMLVSISFYFRGFVSPSLAADIPSFPSCTNPSGTVKSSYSTGTHGIAGNSSSVSGSDNVYTLNGGNNLQCFCSVDGAGIQTNWWKANNLSEGEIETLKKQGWVYIPNGKLWGLDDSPYLAINSNYSCKGSTNDKKDDSAKNSDGGRGGAGSVLGVATSAVGSVLGLANTGNSVLLFLTALTGIVSTVFGYSLKRKNSSK